MLQHGFQCLVAIGRLHSIVATHVLPIDIHGRNSSLTRHGVESLLNGISMFQMVQFVHLDIVGSR